MEKGRVLWSEIMSSGHANEAAHWLENYRFERYPELKKYLLIQYIYTVILFIVICMMQTLDTIFPEYLCIEGNCVQEINVEKHV